MTNPYMTSADTGSGETGINLDAHVSGNPFAHAGAGITVGHTWLIIVLALGLLWLFGMGPLKGVRM